MIYRQGVCQGIYNFEFSLDDAKKFAWYWIGYNTLTVIPPIFASSCIATVLSYRAIVTFIDMILTRKIIKRHNKSCVLCNIDDDTEIIYSHTDILYVLDLFHNDEEKNSERAKNMRVFRRVFNNKLNDSSVINNENKTIPIEFYTPKVEKYKKVGIIRSLFRNYVYEWNPYFKYSSRFVNTHIVAYITLFHFSLWLLYWLIFAVLILDENIQLFDLTAFANMTIGDLLCALGPDFCIDGLSWPLPIPKQVIKFYPEFVPSINALFIAPFFGTLLICSIQVFIGMRDTKKY